MSQVNAVRCDTQASPSLGLSPLDFFAVPWCLGSSLKVGTRLRPKKENSLDPLVKTAALARVSVHPGSRLSDSMQTYNIHSFKR